MLLVRLGAGIGHAVSLPALAAFGLFIGYIAGMFGVGGGFMLTPMLIYAFGVPPAVAVGSALSQKCGTSVASFFKFRQMKRGEPRIDLVMLGGSLIGVDAGTRLLAYLDRLPPWHLASGKPVSVVNFAMDVLFILLLSFTSAYTFYEVWKTRGKPLRGDVSIPGPMVTKIRIPPYIDLPNVGLRQVSMPMLAYLGFFLGVASGMMGIGGGVIFMPILLYGMGLSARNAAGTGVLLLFVTVATGTLEQSLRGFVSLKLSLAILVGSSIVTQLGAVTTHYLPNRYLRFIFSVLVTLTIVFIVWDLVTILR
jgi:uncharacterized membrane protein YfcA